MTVFIDQHLFPRIIYAYIFSDNSIYIGLTKNFYIRNLNRKNCKRDAVYLHKQKTNLEPKIIFLTEFIPAKEAQIKEQEFIDEYKLKGWNVLNRQKGGSLGGSYQKIII